ncbi:MAG: hypothetical protein K6C08_01330, partial [Oscillospiraceae bacterium]|nr:hypothetical protein [Oscillospiraceae bacterium]
MHRVKAVKIALLFLLLAAVAAASVFFFLRENRDEWLDREEAQHIALLDAGTSEGLVYDMSVRLKTDGERTVYEIGFRDYQALYFYVVD